MILKKIDFSFISRFFENNKKHLLSVKKKIILFFYCVLNWNFKIVHFFIEEIFLGNSIFIENDFYNFNEIFSNYDREEIIVNKIIVFILKNNLIFLINDFNGIINSNNFEFKFLDKFEFNFTEKNYEIWKFLVDNNKTKLLNLKIFKCDYLIKISKKEDNFQNSLNLLKMMNKLKITYTDQGILYLIKEIHIFEIIKEIINNNQIFFSSYQKNIFSYKIIHFVVQNKNVEILKLFLKKEEKVNSIFYENSKMMKPIHLAARLN